MAWDVVMSLIFAGVYYVVDRSCEFDELLDQYLKFNDSNYIASTIYQNIYKIKSYINSFRLKMTRFGFIG